VNPDQVDAAWGMLGRIPMSPEQGHALVELVNFAMRVSAMSGDSGDLVG
jgi:hypothetical protein